MSKPILLVISGPSGVGKGTLLNTLVEKNSDKISYSVSATTRERRSGEEEGKTYFYKTKEEFERLIAEGDVLEYDTYSGNMYGTLKSALADAMAAGKTLVLDITVPGAMAVKEAFPDDAVLVFIMPPSLKELESRLVVRGRENQDEIDRRMAFSVEHEISQYKKFDYVVTNDVLNEAVERLEHIMDTSFMATDRNVDVLDKLEVENYLKK